MLLLLASPAFADAFVDTEKRFIEIADVEKQAQTWAVCTAAYDIMATVMQERSPDRAKQLGDLGNGARVSVGMSLIVNDLDPEITTEQFRALWARAAQAMAEWPQQHLSFMLSEAERLGDERAEEFGRKINATVVGCIENLAGQKHYVDSWRELIESGLLAPPSE